MVNNKYKNTIPNNRHKHKNGYLIKKDIETLNKIKAVITAKVKIRLHELSKQFPNLDHVQINYFNTEALKPHKVPERPTGLNWGDAVVQDPISKEYYLCVIVYFNKDNLNLNTFKMLLGMCSQTHIWEYSKQDNLYIDTLGVYVDKVEITKQTEGN